MKKLGRFRLAILAALKNEPHFGLEIAERLVDHAELWVRFAAASGAVYASLHWLETNGLVRTFERPGPAVRGGRPRTFYELTDEGRRRLREES